MKKAVSILLVLIMLSALFPMSAFAAGKDQAYEQYLDIAGKALEKITEGTTDIDADVDVDDGEGADIDIGGGNTNGFLSRLLGKIGTLLTKLPDLINFFCGLDQRF